MIILFTLAACLAAVCFAIAAPAWLIGRITAAFVRFLMEESR